MRKIFVNLHVKDLQISKDFYTNLGFTVNEQFSDDTAVSIVISEYIYVMLLTHDKFKQFTPKEISDATTSTEVLNALSAENRDEVDSVTEAAISSGGSEVRPAQDYGFMYGRAFSDPDGHIWEIYWMDLKKMSEQ